MRLKARTDSNQKEIVSALRKAGRSVICLHQAGKGVPDLLVGYHGINHLLEIKTAKGKTTEAQDSLIDTYKGKIMIIRDAEEAIRLTE